MFSAQPCRAIQLVARKNFLVTGQKVNTSHQLITQESFCIEVITDKFPVSLLFLCGEPVMVESLLFVQRGVSLVKVNDLH
jgi:hypothetical protein